MTGHEECVEALLQHSANFLVRDCKGRTPVHLAAACGHIGVLGGLLHAAQSVETLPVLTDNQGYTPLHWACYNGKEMKGWSLCNENIFNGGDAHLIWVMYALRYRQAAKKIKRSRLVWVYSKQTCISLLLTVVQHADLSSTFLLHPKSKFSQKDEVKCFKKTLTVSTLRWRLMLQMLSLLRAWYVCGGFAGTRGFSQGRRQFFQPPALCCVRTSAVLSFDQCLWGQNFLQTK